jgi:tetraacyldisaccharide 4'-kinase
LQSRDDRSPLEELAGRRFFGFAAIGSPETFERALQPFRTYGAGHWFADHHDYTQRDVDALIAEAKQAGAELLVTTEKDWVKLRRLRIEIPIVRVIMQLKFEEDHAEKLMAQVIASLSSR